MPPKRDTWRMWDCTFESDAKWRRLRADPLASYFSCIGSFVALLSWRTLEGSPEFTRDDAGLFALDVDMDALQRVGLLTPDGFDPESWDTWRPQRYPSETPEATRERKRRSRAADDVTTSHEPVTTGHDSTPSHPTPPQIHPTPSQPIPGPGDDRDALDTYYELTTRRPWGQESGRWVARLQSDYGLADTERAMRAEWASSPNVKDFLGRVDARLARETEKAKQRAQAERAAKVKPSPTARDRRAELQEMMKLMGRTPDPVEDTDDGLRGVSPTPTPDRLPRRTRDAAAGE